MALKVTRVDTWAASMKDKSGALAAKLTALADAGVNLEFVIARRAPEKPGTGVVFVVPITIGRFHDHVVGLGHGSRIADDRLPALAHVTGKDQPPQAAAVADLQFDHRRAQDMAGVVKHDRQLVIDLRDLLVAHGPQQRQGALDVVDGVERLDGILALAAFLAVSPLLVGRIFRLDLGRIAQHQRSQIGRRRGGDDRAGFDSKILALQTLRKWLSSKSN